MGENSPLNQLGLRFNCTKLEFFGGPKSSLEHPTKNVLYGPKTRLLCWVLGGPKENLQGPKGVLKGAEGKTFGVRRGPWGD